MTDTPQLLLAHHLKALKLPTFLREYDKLLGTKVPGLIDRTTAPRFPRTPWPSSLPLIDDEHATLG